MIRLIIAVAYLLMAFWWLLLPICIAGTLAAVWFHRRARAGNQLLDLIGTLKYTQDAATPPESLPSASAAPLRRSTQPSYETACTVCGRLTTAHNTGGLCSSCAWKQWEAEREANTVQVHAVSSQAEARERIREIHVFIENGGDDTLVREIVATLHPELLSQVGLEIVRHDVSGWVPDPFAYAAVKLASRRVRLTADNCLIGEGVARGKRIYRVLIKS